MRLAFWKEVGEVKKGMIGKRGQVSGGGFALWLCKGSTMAKVIAFAFAFLMWIHE